MIEITQQEYDELKSHSGMLGRIGSHLEDFCKNEQDTVEVAVLRLLAEYYFFRSQEANEMMDKVLSRGG